MLSSLVAASCDTHKVFGALRAREFSRLDDLRLAYLDYTGSALYGVSQVRDHHHLLQGSVFGNPHSESSPARASASLIAGAARQVLEFFGARDDTHVVCFTANATAAIKLVAEAYPFSPGRQLLLSADNHNSINGIREFARRAGAATRYLPLDSSLRLTGPASSLTAGAARGDGGLFAFPAQSNFSGVRHPLSLVAHAKALGLDVLLDAAAFAASSTLDLQRCRADFAVFSFYKMFGYPTGVGALVARRSALRKLRRPWFSGGTVTFASRQLDLHELRPDARGFEDGSPDFLGISALPAGFALLSEARMPRIGAHVQRLTARLLDGLHSLRHADRPTIQVYGPRDLAARGGTVTFNVFDAAGRVIPYEAVEQRARDAGVAVRGGCFCNPGASEAAFGYDAETLRRCMKKGFSVERFSRCVGRSSAVGAVRASFGLANNDRDIDRLLEVISSIA